MLSISEYKVIDCPMPRQTGAVHEKYPLLKSRQPILLTPASRYIYPIGDTKWDEAVHLALHDAARTQFWLSSAST
jgi:hypothetical protein